MLNAVTQLRRPGGPPSAAVRGAVAILSLVLLAGALSAHAQAQQLRPFTFILDFLPNGEYGPFFVALEKGWYAEEGLDVTILRGTGSADTLRRVAAGQGDAGIGDFSAVVAARSNDNVAVKAIMVYFRRPPHSIFVLGDSGIENAADLAGKTLATTAGNSHQILFPLLARTAGFDHESVTWVTMDAGAMGPALLLGRVDGAPFLANHEARLQDQAQGFGRTVRRISYADEGVDIYSFVIFARDADIERNADALAAFLRATVRGIEYVFGQGRHEEAGQVVRRYNPEVDLNAAVGAARIAATYAVTQEILDGSAAVGQFERDRTGRSRDVYVEFLSLSRVVDIEELYTNELLPEVK